MSKKVVVAGHACLDITPIFSPELSAGKLGEVLSPGKLIEMQGVDIHTGGAVSNTGLAMKKMGMEVCLMAKTGDDEFGKIMSDIYGQYGAADGIIVQKGERTSYSAVIAVPGIDRIFLHDPGCNHTFTLSDIDEEKLQDVALFHFGYPPLMKKMYENEGEELVNIMKRVKELGIVTSLDLAFVDESSEAGKADWGKILAKVLPYIDIFVPSIEELCCMLDKSRYEEWKQRAADQDLAERLCPEKDIRPLADRCIELGAKVLLLKCGAPGLYFKTAQPSRLKALEEILDLHAEEWFSEGYFERSYVPEKVLSGTGAGDTTIAAFLTAMLNGYSREMCLHLAAAQGASCVEAYDALSGIKPLPELEEKILRGWKKRGAV